MSGQVSHVKCNVSKGGSTRKHDNVYMTPTQANN